MWRLIVYGIALLGWPVIVSMKEMDKHGFRHGRSLLTGSVVLNIIFALALAKLPGTWLILNYLLLFGIIAMKIIQRKSK